MKDRTRTIPASTFVIMTMVILRYGTGKSQRKVII